MRGGVRFEPSDDPDHFAPRRVLGERPLRDHDVVVSQPFVEDCVERFAAEQGRIELDHHVEADLADQTPDDRLDLARRAAVEGREGERVGHAGREGQVAELRQRRRDLRAQPVDDRCRVQHAVEEAAHLVRADAGEIVTDAHVEHGIAKPAPTPDAFSISISIAPLTYSSSDCATVSSCDHSTLKPTVAMSMQGRGTSMASFT